MRPLDLLNTARSLADLSTHGRPRQSDLKRAVSTVYYAVFHSLSLSCADSLVGKSSHTRSHPAWIQAYRAVEHGQAKKRFKQSSVIVRFPKPLQDFAGVFCKLQVDRHRADYDPNSSFLRESVVEMIDEATSTLDGLAHVRRKDLRAFSVWATMAQRRV